MDVRLYGAGRFFTISEVTMIATLFMGAYKAIAEAQRRACQTGAAFSLSFLASRCFFSLVTMRLIWLRLTP